MEDDLFKNFAIMMPTDIYRFPNGAPVLYVSEENKKLFVEWAKGEGIDIKNMAHQQIQNIYVKWKEN